MPGWLSRLFGGTSDDGAWDRIPPPPPGAGYQPRASTEPRGEPPTGGSAVTPPEDREFKIVKLELGPCDILVVTSDRVLPSDYRQKIAEKFKEVVPHNRVLVVDGLHLSVLKQGAAGG